MQASESMQRFPSVPFVDLDLLLDDGLEDPTLHLTSQGQALDIRKAPVVTTGMPGTDGVDGAVENAHESPRSLLNTLTSAESPISSQRTAVDLQNLKILGPDQLKIARDLAGSWNSASGADSELRRSVRNHNPDNNKKPKEKRKVGRPIAYCGDINSPDLTPSERRRILRRIANRELARRVRARRLDLLDDMAQKAKEMEEVNNKLQQRLASVEIKHTAMVNEVQTLDSNLKAKSAENEVLHAQVQKLRRSFTEGEGRAVKAALMSAAGQQVPAIACSFSGESTPSAAELMPATGLYTNSYTSQGPYSTPEGCMLLPSVLPASGSVSGGFPFGFASAAPGLAMQIEPIDRSLSEFLKDEFARSGAMV